MKDFIVKHQTGAYLLLTFLLSWGIFIPFLALSGSDIEVTSPSAVAVSLTIGFAPTVSALLLTALIEGGLKNSGLLAHFKLKNSGRTYLAVMLIMPVYALLSCLLSNLFVTPYTAGVIPFMLVLALTWGFFSSVGEEFGWRGFMLPRLLEKNGWFKSTLLIGFIWGVWHIPMNYLGARNYGDYMVTSVILSCCQLIFDGFIISELFVISRGSLKVTILYHYTLTGMTIMQAAVCRPIEFSYVSDLCSNLIGYAVKTAIIVVIYFANRKTFSAGLAAESTVSSAHLPQKPESL